VYLLEHGAMAAEGTFAELMHRSEWLRAPGAVLQAASEPRA
jgi:hypothetical protein